MPTGDFQTSVNNFLAPAVAGDFASTNPRFTVDAGPGQFVAGAAGISTARFAWVDVLTNTLASNTGVGAPTGFMARQGQPALITAYLGSYSTLVPQGMPVTLFSGGDFWVTNDGTNEVVIGMKAYARYADGKIQFAATASPPTAAVATGSIGPGIVTSFTASIAAPPSGSTVDSVMTVTALATGSIVVNGTISGSGVVSGTQITQQLSGGTVGGVGTYGVSIPQTVASTTITETYGILTVGTLTSGTIGIGDVLTGGTITAGTFVIQLGTGTGGTGTYYVAPSQTVGAQQNTYTSAIETKWYAVSVGATGELIKMSSHALG